MNEIHEFDPILKRILPNRKPCPGVNYIPSQFILSFEREKKHYIYNTLTKQFLEAELPSSAKAGEGYDFLIENMFLVPEDRDECTYYESISSLVRSCFKKTGIQEYIIMPTLACNARCVYCYEAGMDPVTMSPETIQQTIQFIRNNHDGKPVHLRWFGGEPLLRPEIIDQVCIGLKQAGIDYKSAMTSNASLITSEIVKKMTGLWKLRKIQVSMDGSEQEYIRRKQYPVYHDEYYTVVRNINLLVKAGIRVSIRCNVDEDNCDSLPAFVDDLKEAIRDKEKVTLYCCPLNNVRRSQQCYSVWQTIIEEIKPQIRHAGFRTSTLSGMGSRFRASHCMADNNGIVIAPDGSLFPCEHCPPKARCGDVLHGITDEKARQSFCSIGPTREKCRKCVFLPACTSFSNCPVQDVNCKEIRQMAQMEILYSMLQKQEESPDDASVC